MNKRSQVNSSAIIYQSRDIYITIIVFTTSLLATVQAMALPPVASITGPTSGDPLVSISFNASSSSVRSGGISIDRYLWDFGDGTGIVNSFTISTQGHVFTADGNYTVTVAVTDNQGLTDVAAMSIFIGTCPVFGDRANGQILYDTNCKFCHGDQGLGNITGTVDISVTGTDPANIETAITSVALMNGVLPNRTPADLQDMAAYIACGPPSVTMLLKVESGKGTNIPPVTSHPAGGAIYAEDD